MPNYTNAPSRFFVLALLFLPLLAQAQPDSSARAVAATIGELFDGMRASDSLRVAAVFLPEARLQSAAVGADGQVRVQTTPIARFVSQLGQAPIGALDERLAYTEIRVDGPLATAWTPYTFVYNGQLSHCGVNAFQLVRTDGRWRILQITDTRRRTGCDTALTSPAVAIDSLVDRWHRAAATADEAVFFGSMAADGIYIGTDATEHWLRDSMQAWAAPYFERGTAWAFTPYDRHIFYDAGSGYAWWDELLQTWMGVCRGSGVARREADGQWKITHYHLSVTVPNEKIEQFIELVDPEK